MLMQKIWLVKTSEIPSFFTKEKLLKKLPKSMWYRANRYLDNESSTAYIIGRLLLKKALVDKGVSVSILEDIYYTKHGKPCLKELQFSISHSKGYVILVFGTASSVGIDIEKKENIDLGLFQYLFREDEWKHIMEATDSLTTFYWYWVRKEALLKAAGASLKELKLLDVFEDYGCYKRKLYYFTTFEFDTAFSGVMAMEKREATALEILTIDDLV